MNTQQIVESIRQVFPALPRNQIRLDVDNAQKLLASETGSITARSSLSSIATNFAWALPTGFTELVDLVFYDSDDEPKYIGDYNYKYEIELGKLFIYSLTSTPITGLSTEISSAYIHYKVLPATLTTESTAMEIAEQFRDAVESYVLGKYFSKFPIDFVSGGQVVKALNLQAAQLHKSEYEKLRIKLKKYFNSQTTSSGIARNYEHAGAYALPRRPNDETSGSTISVAALRDIYEKYAYFKTSAEGTITPSIEIGYTTISCLIDTNTLTLTSTAEFGVGTQILPSNWDCSWVKDSTSQYTITLPSGWATQGISLEVYLRD